MSAPPAERVTHPTQGYSDREANRIPAAPSMEGVCPDVRAIVRDLAALGVTVKPSKLQGMYDRLMANADADFDFGSHVLTRLLGRGGSRPVDTRVGERVARRLTR